MHIRSGLLSASLVLIISALSVSGAVQQASAPLLNSPPGQPPLPSSSDANAAALAANLNLSNIQSETFIGMKQKEEAFYFFQINDATTFKKSFGANILPLITTTKQITSQSTSPNTSVNVAFSQFGLNALNITDSLGDQDFSEGQFQNADALGDPGTVNWVPQFTKGSVHGVFLVASNNQASVNSQLRSIQKFLGKSISTVYQLAGSARPGAEVGHEHFGFLDGISQPAITGFNTPLPGQRVVSPGFIVLGHGNDQAPAWAKDSSFLAFRQLKQLVPEFNKFLTDNPLKVKGLTPAQGSDLLGARMVGRWKSGAPVDLSPLFDNVTLGSNPELNNDFTFNHTDKGFDLSTNQTFCPFSAHIRKTNPRADLDFTQIGIIVRGGIPYGPEVSAAEASSGKSSTAASQERGLAFVAYQSVINQGFSFLQEVWADNQNFVHSGVGVDPIIGSSQVTTPKGKRVVSGLDPTNQNKTITLVTDFVVSRGGEYFLSPSISALQSKFSA